MIKGMTGFGTAKVSAGDVKGVIEVKSVNHRYLDLVFYLPIGFGEVESKVRRVMTKTVRRGRVTVSFKITGKPQPKISMNKKAVKQYLSCARGLKKEFHLDNNLKLSDLIKLPGVVEAQEVFVTPDKIWPVMEKALLRSLSSLETMRKREGQALSRDINSLLRRMSSQVKRIEARTKTILREKKKDLLAEEFSSFQKGIDVNEEIARLKHYIEEFRAMIKSTASAGKKLDFIGQEMQRETNTIGSKLQDKVVSNCVISLKSKIEKLREQAQNIE